MIRESFRNEFVFVLPFLRLGFFSLWTVVVQSYTRSHNAVLFSIFFVIQMLTFQTDTFNWNVLWNNVMRSIVYVRFTFDSDKPKSPSRTWSTLLHYNRSIKSKGKHPSILNTIIFDKDFRSFILASASKRPASMLSFSLAFTRKTCSEWDKKKKKTHRNREKVKKMK